MAANHHEFLAFAMQNEVLKLGEFTLKSGRVSPYFFNAGLFQDGAALSQLGKFYAQAIVDSGMEYDMLFGPAYKGIPLVAAVSIALHDHHKINVPWCFNRKEAKTHGEGGQLVGAPLQGNVLVVDDVMTAGTAVSESIRLIKRHKAQPCGVALALDRQEIGPEEMSATQYMAHKYQLRVISIAGMHDLISYLAEHAEYTGELAAMLSYRKEYGVDIRTS